MPIKVAGWPAGRLAGVAVAVAACFDLVQRPLAIAQFGDLELQQPHPALVGDDQIHLAPGLRLFNLPTKL